MLQCDPRNRSTYHSGQLKVHQRFSGGVQFLVSYTYGKALDYGGSAASGGGAVGNPQTVTDLDAGHGPVRLRRPAPRGDQRRLRAAVGPEPALAARGRRARRDRRRLAARRHRDRSRPGGRSPCSCRPASTTARRAGRTGSGRASWTIRPWISGTTRPTSWRRRPTPTATAAAASCMRPGHVNFDTSLSKRVHGRRAHQRRVPRGTRSTCSTTRVSASRTRTSTRRPPAASRRRSVDNRSMQFSLKFNF